MNTLLSIPAPNSIKTDESIKVIVFSIFGKLMALPIMSVLKVIPSPPILGETVDSVGFVEIDNYTITLLNLHKKLAQIWKKNAILESDVNQGQFFLIAHSGSGELCGIFVDVPPDLIDIPLSTIHVLPESYRKSASFGIANYAAVLHQGDSKLIVFLLDLNQALQTMS